MREQPIDRLKAQLGTVATYAWLIGGVFAFVVDRGFGGLFSLQAFLFLGVGMFFAAAAAGLLAYKVFLGMADRAALAAGAGGARQAVQRAAAQSLWVSRAIAVVLVTVVYLSLFKV